MSELPTKPTLNLVYKDEATNSFLYQGDCLDVMDELLKKHPEGCFDMIFADPPYFLSNGGISCQNGEMVSVNKGAWDQSKGLEQTHQFNLDWLSRCQALLKPNGTIWVTGTHHIIHSIGFAMQTLGYKVLNDITWEKPNPPPNLSCRFFTHATETIIWAAKNKKSKHTFAYETMREQNNGKQMKSVWQFLPPSHEEKFFGKHPTQKPVRLLERIVIASTQAGDFVFDPFAGSCTTAVAAIKLDRRFCGVEMECSFIEIAIARLQNLRDRDD
jgi:site-specific DNA-methyltransferase (adenine-specific)